MDELLRASRHAFRSLHGLPVDAFGELSAEAREALPAWALRHRVQALLQAGLPGPALDMHAAARGRAHHSARWTAEAERLFAALSPALSSLALVKGPGLAAQAWPDPALRSYDDLDFLCRRQDLPLLLTGMQSAGYTPDVADPRRRSHLWHYGWGIAFLHPDGFRVEVSPQFFRPHYPWPRRLDARSDGLFMEQWLDSAAVRIPAPPLHLLQSSLHAVWHGWARLAWVADLAGLLVRHPGAWTAGMALAATCPFARRTLAAGCAVAEAIFGPGLLPAAPPSVPPSVLDEARTLLSGTARSLRGRELRRFHEQFMTRRETSLYRLRRVFTPGDGDFLWVALPVAARGLYWLLRPVRGVLYGKR